KIAKCIQDEKKVFENNRGPSNLELKYIQEQLNKAMSDLPPMRRKVFELSRLHGLSYKEIAIRLSISEKTVENHINHALKQLRHSFPLLSILLVLFKNNF
ncbi:MAG TPA: sigma-70 family RNA polymerase sigma factor, partial [Flavisolibacter sp.]|nr:sigma-70 family RNA polymerase sigma factor [Flavisolibacter sp.]